MKLNEKRMSFFDGVASEKRMKSAKRKIGKMLVDMYESRKAGNMTAFDDMGIVALSKKYGFSTYSLHKNIGFRVEKTEWDGNKYGVRLSESDFSDIGHVVALYLHWRNSVDSKESKEIIESVFTYLFMKK